MSFNRRGGPDRRPDRPPRREGFGDRPGGRGPYPPRDRPPRDRPPREGGERPYGGGRGGDRPFSPRPRFDRAADEGGMSIRLDPRRLQALKHLAGEAGMRPGDLVRHWVEERIDAARTGEGGVSLEGRIGALEERIAGLESRLPAPAGAPEAEAEAVAGAPSEPSAVAPAEEAPAEEPRAEEAPAADGPPKRRRRVSAAPAARVALHDEMIAVLRERGPMAAGELAAAIAERGRYAPPRSGKPLDAAMVSQRASNPAYRSRFVRREGRIGLAEDAV